MVARAEVLTAGRKGFVYLHIEFHSYPIPLAKRNGS